MSETDVALAASKKKGKSKAVEKAAPPDIQLTPAEAAMPHTRARTKSNATPPQPAKKGEASGSGGSTSMAKIDHASTDKEFAWVKSVPKLARSVSKLLFSL